MANAKQLFIDLISRDKTGPGSRSAAANLDDVGEAAEGAAKSTEKLGKESDRAEDQVERLGKSGRSAAQHVERLDREIEACEHDLHGLAVAFAEAGTAAERADLTKSIRSTQRELKQLEKSKGVLSKGLLPDAGDAKQIEKAFSGVLSDAVENAKVGPVLAVGIAAAAPLIGATISAAVIGAAGVGGVVGGVLLASKDPRVSAAGKQLGQTLLGQLQKDAGPFVEPVLKAIDKVEAGFTAMNGRISHIFQGSSGFLGPLVDGALKGVDGILRGVDSLVTKGKPVIDQLGKSFGQLGRATGAALETIAGGSDDAAKALGDLTDVLDVTIRGTGYLVRGLTELYGPVTALPRAWKDAELSVLRWNATAEQSTSVADRVISVGKTLTAQLLSTGEAAGKAGQQMQTYGDKMDVAATKGQGLYGSQISVAQAMADATEAAKKNGKTLDLNTQKGRDNSSALNNLASSLTANYDAYVKVNGEGRGAQKVAENNRAAFVRLAISMGKGKTEAEALATQLGLIPAKKTTDFYANTHDAAARLDALNSKANRAARSRTLNVRVSVSGTERLDSLGHRIGGYRAAGGPVTAGKAYVVGEKRPEVFVPNQSGTIIPSISQYSSGAGGSSMATASGGGGGWVAIRGDAVINALTQAIAAQVSAKGGRAAQLGIRFS